VFKPLTLMREATSVDGAYPIIVWPHKCCCTGVKFASIAEILAVPPAVTGSTATMQASAQPKQTFGESLLAVSKASSDTSTAYDGNTKFGRQKSVLKDAKLPSTVARSPAFLPPAPSPQTPHQQVLVAQQLPLINLALIPMQLPLGASVASPTASTVAASPATGDAIVARPLGIESDLAQPGIVPSDSVPSDQAQKDSDLQQAPSISPRPTPIPVGHAAMNAPEKGNVTLASGPLSTGHAEVPSGQAQKDGDLQQASSISPRPTPIPVVHAATNAPGKGNVAPASSPLSTGQAQVPSGQAQKDSDLQQAPSILPWPTPIPVVHAATNASGKGEVAPASSPVSTGQANPQAAAPDPSGFASGLSIPGATAGQLTALIQPGSRALIIGQAGASSSSAAAKPSAVAGGNDKDAASNAINDATGLKQHAPSASDQAGSQTGSQDTSASADQTPGSASPQGQSGAQAQMSFANHTVAATDHTQNAGITSPMQTAPTLAGIPGHSAKTPETPAPASIALPQALPVINTAKLIQSMGQSEMRVGMRSNDFGNISISTSATRDLISAQISLDHNELARTLATHLPEMQTRFGGTQAMDVRIDVNGLGGATSAGMSNGSANESHGDRQQRGSAPSGHAANGFAEQGRSVAAPVMPSGEGRLDARLDIRA
jgi:hypothetical protein